MDSKRQLPLLLVVEDNGYGISSPTRRTNPLALNVLASDEWTMVEGWDVERVYHRADAIWPFTIVSFDPEFRPVPV